MFAKRFEFSLTDAAVEHLKRPKHHRTQRDHKLSALTSVREYVGVVEQLPLDEHQFSPGEAGWSKNLVQNFEIDEGDPERADFLNIILRYMDLYAHPTPKNYGYRTVYLAHALNHVVCTRNCVISNNRKLDMAASMGQITDDLIEATRDQGFVRPTVLIICPFKKDAFDIVERLELLTFGKDTKASTWNRERFHNEFKSEVAPLFKTRLAEEFKELLTGNNDDCFRVGIALSKKVLKLYEAFDKVCYSKLFISKVFEELKVMPKISYGRQGFLPQSFELIQRFVLLRLVRRCRLFALVPRIQSDFILCSPLGLRMILDGDAGRESHLISNIQIVVVDKADIMLQQNWEHLSIIFSHLHSQPSKINTDISRVRQCYIDGMSKYYCQLLLFSRYEHELFSALILEHSLNYHGLVIQNRSCNGTLDKIEIPLCQELRRFAVDNASEQAVLRFDFFKQYCLSLLSPGTCVVIPSYFDFVRVRNYFKRSEESFVACHEYAPKNKITRARDLFYHKMKKILLVTERYYYFNRRPLKGITKVVFYQLPSHPDLYCEFINMATCEAGTRFSSVLFYCQYDRIRLQNTFGSDLANSIISSKKTIHAIVSE